MEQIKLELPKFEYKSLMWEDKDNVTYEGRSKAFEEQNKKYFLAGFNKENTKYKQAFSTLKEHTDFADTLFDRYTVYASTIRTTSKSCRYFLYGI